MNIECTNSLGKSFYKLYLTKPVLYPSIIFGCVLASSALFSIILTGIFFKKLLTHILSKL